MKTKRDPTELQFEQAVKDAGWRWMSLSKPYMRETEPGYDSPFTNHAYCGFRLALGLEKK